MIGRKEEQKILARAACSEEAELVAVIGRRRVGKTFLINTVYKEKIVFEITGVQNASKSEQLDNFIYQLGAAFGAKKSIEKPDNWINAFILLIQRFEEQKYREKKVIFLDELPWLATHRSGFLRGLSFFWNSWAVRENIVLVICGSAASWMIQKVINHKGGLHNRVTKRIHLAPFTLAETKTFLKSRAVQLDHYQILQLYMAMGGIPHYLKKVVAGKSAMQNIDQICFSETGLLRDEFSRLYPALFSHSEKHISLIRALATKKKGMTRRQIVKTAQLPEGGGTSKVLEELEHSGFIDSYYPFDKKKKEKLYRLIDEYSLFYLQFIEKRKQEGKGTWQHLSQTQAYKAWSGYAYESICIKHLPQIKKALSIAGIYTQSSSFYYKGNSEEKGTQIDLVLDRNDHLINLFEIKFHKTNYSLSKVQAENLREKTAIFRARTKTRKQIFVLLITTFGLKANQHSIGLINNSLTMDDLFLP